MGGVQSWVTLTHTDGLGAAHNCRLTPFPGCQSMGLHSSTFPERVSLSPFALTQLESARSCTQSGSAGAPQHRIALSAVAGLHQWNKARRANTPWPGRITHQCLRFPLLQPFVHAQRVSKCCDPSLAGPEARVPLCGHHPPSSRILPRLTWTGQAARSSGRRQGC